MAKIFIVEDDDDIRELTMYALENAGFFAQGFENGELFFAALKETMPDLVLLDIMLPGEDGLEILKKFRQKSAIPVIMLTAKGSEADKVRGLNLGADDYVPKPFGVTELIARINAVLRRSTFLDRSDLSYKKIHLQEQKRRVFVDNESITLTFTEFELLHYLLLNVDLVLSREKLMNAVWGYDYEGESRTVDMHIKSLRQKLKEAGEYIKTVRHIGYKLGE